MNHKKKTEDEHKKRNGLTGNILQKIWDSELRAISKQKSILLGSSCLLVAKKNHFYLGYKIKIYEGEIIEKIIYRNTSL